MDELFGAPLSSIVMVLAVVFAIMAGALVFIAARNPILVRMALRNVGRRPARSVLIVIGLMLATAIISSAFTTGDSITFSIKRSATDSLRSLDELIRVDEDSDVWEGKVLPDEFSDVVFQEMGPLLESDPDIDGVVPALVESVAVINLRSRQFEVEALYSGLDPVTGFTFNPYANPPTADAGVETTSQPAHLFGTAPAEVGTFLVSHSGLNNGNSEFVQVVRIDNPLGVLGATTFTQEFINVGNIDNIGSMPDAPQLGGALAIDTNDRRALNAVWRNNSLWMTATIPCRPVKNR